MTDINEKAWGITEDRLQISKGDWDFAKKVLKVYLQAVKKLEPHPEVSGATVKENLTVELPNKHSSIVTKDYKTALPEKLKNVYTSPLGDDEYEISLTPEQKAINQLIDAVAELRGKI